MNEKVEIEEINDDFDTIGNYLRARQITSYNKGMANVFEAMRAYP